MSLAEILHAIVAAIEDLTGRSHADLHAAVDSVDAAEPVPEASKPVPPPDQPSDTDTPAPVFGSESEPEAAEIDPPAPAEGG